MPERIIIIIFFALCLGQIWALSRGRLTAVIYYICVATLPYFSFWMFVSWDCSRVCGGLLVLGGFVLYRRRQKVIPKGGNRLFLFSAYLVVITVAGSLFWPIEAMNGRSSAYGFLRGYIQIINWAIIIGTAWQIALVLREKGAFEKMRRAFVAMGMAHCAVALYQVAAFWTGLPLTGVRRVGVGVGLDMYNPQFSIATIAGLPLFRATSFVGEPRSLAAASMLWIAALFTLYAEGRANTRVHLAMLLSLLVLTLTLSTSGWGSFFFCLFLMSFLGFRQRKLRFGAFSVVSLFLGILLAVDSMGWLPGEISLKEVFAERWTNRIVGPFSDLPVRVTLETLSTNPQFVLFGTGCGGMSFYIAKALGGREVILASTVGFVNYLGDIGLVGILLMIAAMWCGIRNLLFRGVQCDDVSRYTSFMGCVFLCATLISAPSYILSCAFGFLLASEFRSRTMARSSDPRLTLKRILK